MKTWEVYRKEHSSACYVKDLRSDGFDPKTEAGTLWDEDVMLLFRYPEGDCDDPSNKEMMYTCLYDLFQCNSSLSEGDVFETPFGRFMCQGVEVVPMEES